MALRCSLDRMIQELRVPQPGFLVAQQFAQMMLVQASAFPKQKDSDAIEHHLQSLCLFHR